MTIGKLPAIEGSVANLLSPILTLKSAIQCEQFKGHFLYLNHLYRLGMKLVTFFTVKNLSSTHQYFFPHGLWQRNQVDYYGDV